MATPRVLPLSTRADRTRDLARLPAAIDYGLHGLQTWGVSLEVWLAMSQAHEAVLAIISSWKPGMSFFEDLVALNRAAAGLHRLLGQHE